MYNESKDLKGLDRFRKEILGVLNDCHIDGVYDIEHIRYEIRRKIPVNNIYNIDLESLANYIRTIYRHPIRGIDPV